MNCRLLLLLFGIFLFVAIGRAGLPDWSVDPSSYQYTSTITGQLFMNDTASLGGNIIGAFAGNTVRGVATPIQVGNSWLYFMTLYSNNTTGDTITFKAYIGEADLIVDVNETIIYTANSIIGSPDAPFLWHGYANYDYAPVVSGITDQTIEEGSTFLPIHLDTFLTTYDADVTRWSVSGNSFINVTIDANHVATISAPPGFTGSETIIFTATDSTVHQYADSDTAIFTILPIDLPPVISDIPDQRIGLDGNFNSFDLNDYLITVDGGSVAWKYKFQHIDVGMQAPEWSVNPSLYQFTMNLTVEVSSRGNALSDGENILAAFSGSEVRGVSQSISVGNKYLFFLTVYANTQDEVLSFRYYDVSTHEILPVQERITFTANGVLGLPENPYLMHGGNLIVTIQPDNTVSLHIVDSTWVGTEQVLFIATDVNTLHSYADTDAVAFSVVPDHTPRVRGINDQTMESGQTFYPFDLDDYLVEKDGDQVTWSVSGNLNLQVIIDNTHRVNITPVNTNWHGTESLIFKVTDNTSDAFFSLDTALFTIEPLDHPPQVSMIPNQTIGILGSFHQFDLDTYMQEQDGDSIEWSFEDVTPPRWNSPPAWNMNPAQFQFSMNVTVEVSVRHHQVLNSSYVLAAFAGNELRGMTTPVQAGNTWLFFLTILANTEGEAIQFKVYDESFRDCLPVKEKLNFSANAVIGTPESPFELNAGNILLTINPENKVTCEIVDSLWTGSETIQFTARDANRTHHYADSDNAIFTIISDHSPVVKGIPDHVVEKGNSFPVFKLDTFLEEYDGQSVTWGASYSSNYRITIDAEHNVTVIPRDPQWTGSEDIVFQARDISANNFTGEDTVTFTVVNIDHAPIISEVLSQEITPSGVFADFDLDNYLMEQDGDSVQWSVAFQPPPFTDQVPEWNIVPSNYQYSMTVTASVTSLGKIPESLNNYLAAFAGNELRGVTSPFHVGNTWLYFLTIYANEDGEPLRFQFYDATTQRLLPIKETVNFSSNSVLGEPMAPYQCNAGNLLFNMNVDNSIHIERTLDDWLGTESLMFTVQDMGTNEKYADTVVALFTVVLDAFGNKQASIAFGDIPVHTTATETVYVTNDGNDDLIISSISVNNTEYSVSPVNLTIPYNGMGYVLVTFSPSSSGDKPCNLAFEHNAYRSPRIITLQGSGQYLHIQATRHGDGTISPEGLSAISYSSGQMYSIAPNHGYRIDSVVVDGINHGIVTEYEFNNITHNHSITAYFSIIPLYGVSYRTANAEDWATAVDLKNQRLPLKRKYDKVIFEFDLQADQTRLLSLNFNMNVQAVITKGTTTIDTIASFSGKKVTMNLSPFLAIGETIHIKGTGDQGRYVTSKYAWSTNNLKVIMMKQYTNLKLGLPLPNLHNVGKEMFGVGQRGSIFPAGLRIGVPLGPKGNGAVIHMKYTDVIKSFGSKTDTGWFLHTQPPRCLDVYNSNNPILNRERNLTPAKQNNKLFAEALALKLNVSASNRAKFPVGLGELTYDDTLNSGNPFNGMIVKDIMAKADTMLACRSLARTPATLADLYETIIAINNAFRINGSIDTISFAKTTRLTGVKQLADVLYMRATPGVVADPVLAEQICTDEVDIPSVFALAQNYPNPFHPQTTIQFSLMNPSTVKLTLYNVLGQAVLTIMNNEEMNEGIQSVEIDGTDLSSGVYFYKLEATSINEEGMNNTFVDIKKMVLAK